jgi:Sulfotransferase family
VWTTAILPWPWPAVQPGRRARQRRQRLGGPGCAGPAWPGFWATELERALAARTTADLARFHDVGYEALVADPLREVARLYTRLGLELSGAARQRMRRWIQRHHHPGRRRSHRYALAEFGLDPDVVERRFARYREWMGAVTSS